MVFIGLSDDGELPAGVWEGQDSLWACSYASRTELWGAMERDYDLTGNAMREALTKVFEVVHTKGLKVDAKYRKRLTLALQRWLDQNPDWAVFADKWLSENT